jgi:hypothetical protein
MSETKTPVEVATGAVESALMDYDPVDWKDAPEIARAALGSVDVDGLAAEIGRHWLLEPSHAYGGARRVTRSCNCGRTLAPQHFEWRHSQEMTQHEAEAVKAWLTGGGA